MALFTWIQVAIYLLVVFGKDVTSYYISADYYMDPTQSDAFGGVCNHYISAESLFINSHMNPFDLVNYGNDKRCHLVLDAGSVAGARYRLKVIKWQIEVATNNGTCSDYLAIYDSDDRNFSLNTTRRGVYCGAAAPNLTDVISRRYTKFVWVTDSRIRDKGFRILAVWIKPPPCKVDQFHCTLEDVCIPISVRCDGSNHCDDGSDELICSGLENFVRVFLRLGLSGIVAVGVTVAGLLILLCVASCYVKYPKENKVSDINGKKSGRFHVSKD